MRRPTAERAARSPSGLAAVDADERGTPRRAPQLLRDASAPTGSLSSTPVARFRLHQAVVRHLGADDEVAPTIVDLGCGTGRTLAVIAERNPRASLVGIDVDGASLAEAATWLSRLGARYQLVQADLSQPLPLSSASVSRIVCHDVLECLYQPQALLEEAYRVLEPGGLSVWSHVDYASTVISGGDPAITSRVIQAYAERPQPGMPHCNGLMGRQLAALVERSPLEVTVVDAETMVKNELVGPARMRVNDIAATLRRPGAGGLEEKELEDWIESLHAAADAKEFFFAQTAYMVLARRPAPAG